MRLLDTTSGQFREVPEHKLHELRYAILSHCWNQEGETSYHDMCRRQLTQVTSQPGTSSSDRGSATVVSKVSEDNFTLLGDAAVSEKIRRACGVARSHGYRYIWIDSCCIDQTSSAELSEAINSMYRWYRDASICYAFLEDVPDSQDRGVWKARFRQSRWFRRGWTLQELVAPRVVLFLSASWSVLGVETALVADIQEDTGLDMAILTHDKRVDEVSVATRMSWASERDTTRIEDEAYSLMGLFDVTMPTLYGEG